MSNKFYSVKHRSSGATRIAKAPNPALAIICYSQTGVGSARPFEGVKAATDEQVFEHTAVKKRTLHPQSRERADGLKLFVVPLPGEAEADFDLIRAKNADDAYSLITEVDFEVTQLGQEELLELVGGALDDVLEYTPPPKRKRAKKGEATPPPADAGAATNGAGPSPSASDEAGTADGAGAFAENDSSQEGLAFATP